MGGGALIVLDTHVIVWLLGGVPDLGPKSRDAIDREFENDSVAVSAISFWEVAMLVSRRRLAIDADVSTWRSSILRLGIIEIPVAGEIAISAAGLEQLSGDPADRLIAATALSHSASLVTADRRILRSKISLRRLNART